MSDYKNLVIWQKAFDLTMAIYDAADQFPAHEQYGLGNQIERAVVSIPSNIAEGYGRSSDKEFYYFLNVARGSLYEVQTQLYIAMGRNYIDAEKAEKLNASIDELGRMISGFLRRLEMKDPGLRKR